MRFHNWFNLPINIASSPNYKWWVYFAVAIGQFMTVMDQTGVNIALPRIAEHFDADIPTVQWVTLGYVLSTSIMLMPAGRLADILGRKRVFISGLFIFMCAAAIGGISQSYPILIGAKLLQGVGAGAIQGNAMAMVTETFPPKERGKALGMYMAIIGAGSISGPVLGGFLVSSFGWRSVFFSAIPVGLIAVAASAVVLKGGTKAVQDTSVVRTFDWIGAGLSSGALVSFLLSMTNGYRFGWSASPILVGFALSILFMIVFLWWESWISQPMLDLSLFRTKVFSIGVSARSLGFLSTSSVFFLMPFYIVQVLGHASSTAGLLMVPGSIGTAVIAPIGGRLSDKIGTKSPAVVGLFLSFMAMLIFIQLESNSHWSHIVAGMALFGSGMGLFSASNTSAVLGSLARNQYGIATAFLNLVRTSSNVTGVAIATTITSVTMGALGYEPNLGMALETGDQGVKIAFVKGLIRVYIVSGSFVLLALLLSLLRGESQSVVGDV